MKKIKRIIRAVLNRSVQTYYSLFGSKVECNICHYKTDILNSDAWHNFSVCPRCGSGVRLRLLWATLNSTSEWSIDKLIKNKAVLHFAPEKAISDLVERVARKYKTADLLADGYLNAYHHIDYNMDISDMHQLHDGEYDCIIACDVLEHVHDDKKALREVYRVLSKSGYCIFTVPQKDRLEKTYEDLALTDPKESEEKFGQLDHQRIYRNDFVQMMQDAGFEIVQVDESDFDDKRRTRNVLYPPVFIGTSACY
ncbi:MAG: methyltransferase domain-containing protein [Ferruginibacter sp.]